MKEVTEEDKPKAKSRLKAEVEINEEVEQEELKQEEFKQEEVKQEEVKPKERNRPELQEKVNCLIVARK